MEIKNRRKYEAGVSLITLAVVIMIMFVIIGIVVHNGTGVLKKAKLEELKTNMLLIQAKARGYVEDATFKMGINPEETKQVEVRNSVYEQEAKLEKAEEIPSEFGNMDMITCYWVTEESLNDWGLNKIKLGNKERYLIRFDEENAKVEIYNTLGYEEKYSLSDIEQIQE